MEGLQFVTRDASDPKGKPRVWFACHPEDFDRCFPKLREDLFKTHDCVIYYTRQIRWEDTGGLESMNLFVFPVTKKLLCSENRAMEVELPFARKHHIPILPVMMEPGLDQLYSQPERFGESQYLNPGSADDTEVSYGDKLKRYLESVLVDDRTAKRIRSAFDAYIFLSYRKKDRQYANRLMRLIHSDPACRDIAIWFDEFLTPGESFKENIEKVLKDSKLFALLVTPHLLEEPDGKPNFVMGEEYPAACRSGMKILPAQMVQTDREQLQRKFAGIPDCLNLDSASDRQRLLSAVATLARREERREPGHIFLMGLAYLNGIDMEVDRQRGFELIRTAAQAGLPEAMEKLIRMYTDGDGVSLDARQAEAWSLQLAEYYFERVFGPECALVNAEYLQQLFREYKDPYYAGVIRGFLRKADQRLAAKTMEQLASWITGSDLREYTLLLDACREMERHRLPMQQALVTDILKKSLDGTYPPYGPLFWYVPEYDLYDALTSAAAAVTEPAALARGLALIRDVFVMFAGINSGPAALRPLYERAKPHLSGVRGALCKLFYENKRIPAGEDVYPRCFNTREAARLLAEKPGIFGRCAQPFADELSLFSHEMYSELDGEYIGVVACPYDRKGAAEKLRQKPSSKLRGLILSPTEDTRMDYIPFHRTSVRVLYIPENITDFGRDYRLHMPLEQGVACNEDGVVYFRSRVSLENTRQIPAGMFQNCPMLQQVELCPEITGIGDAAFQDCTGLLAVELPLGLEELGRLAFCNCEKLACVRMSRTLTQIPDAAFYGCAALQGLTIPGEVTRIGVEAFRGCRSLRKLKLPAAVTSIGEAAFAGCSGLEEMDVPSGITELKALCFSGSGIGRISLPEGLVRIGESCFCNTNLTTLQLPGGLRHIESWAFSDSQKLEQVLFPEGLTTIGSNAFAQCPRIRELYIPDSVTQIGQRCFFQNQLRRITLPGRFYEYDTSIRIMDVEEVNYYGELPRQEDPFAWMAAAMEETKEEPPAPPPPQKRVVIPEGTTEIGDRAFAEDRELVEVVLPDSVLRIGQEAFAECGNLRKLRLPARLQELGAGAFRFCFGLQDLQLPPTLTRIGPGAFQGCGISQAQLPQGLTAIPERLFSRCRELKQLQLPETIRQIGRNAFSSSGLEQIRLPKGLQVIGDSAFERTAITEICLPEALEEIGHCAFQRCQQLQAIRFPESVAVIGCEAFAGCAGLTEVEIPATVRHIGDGAFEYCVSLKRVRISANFQKDVDRIFPECQLENVQLL